MGSIGKQKVYSQEKHNIDVKGGNLRYSFEYPNSDNKPVMYVHGILVDEDKRGQGIGTQLLEKAKKVADRENVVMELFAVPIHNNTMTEKELIAWYEKRGFKLSDGDNMLRYIPRRKK